MISIFGSCQSSIAYHTNNHFSLLRALQVSFTARSNLISLSALLHNCLKLPWMELNGFTNKVLHLFLAQNNLLITGYREQLIKRLGTTWYLPTSTALIHGLIWEALKDLVKRFCPILEEPNESNTCDKPLTQPPETSTKMAITRGISQQYCTQPSQSCYINRNHCRPKAAELGASPS